MSEFGFTVERVDEVPSGEWVEDSVTAPDGRTHTFRKYLRRKLDTPLWKVYLPHQCDEWQIATDEESYAEQTTHEKAVAWLERFIAEAQEALEALKAGQEHGQK